MTMERHPDSYKKKDPLAVVMMCDNRFLVNQWNFFFGKLYGIHF